MRHPVGDLPGHDTAHLTEKRDLVSDMTTLYLCEKPSQARDIARILGARHKGEGYLMDESSGQRIAVTWCYGHLLEMVPPDGYDPAFKRWSLDTLPIIPTEWRLAARPDGRGQLKVIQALLKAAAEVIIATDADREGELIAREVLTLFRWRGPVRRLWLSALDDTSIRKALAALLPGTQTEPLWQAGLGRARADWLVGMNLTRAYTVTGRRAGYDGVLSVGRVQTPTLRLIVDRDRTIESFVPVAYFDVFALFGLAGDGEPEARRFRARWAPPGSVVDTEGRCLKREAAEAVVARVTGQTGKITQAETRRVKEPPPLPFDLSNLQQVASRRWGMGAQQVLDTAQALYETHKAITYPRTDCPYLPNSQHAEAPGVLAAVAASDPGLAVLVQGANPALRSRAWDDAKITAHHAIIPTAAKVDVGRMKTAESQVYDLIRRRYLAQFYPAYEYDRTEVEVDVEQALFRTTGRVMRVLGWRLVLGGESPAEGEDEEPALPAMTLGEPAKVLETSLEDKQTRPPPRYTEGTLIAAMKNVGRTVADPKLKKVLKETAGIGTEATRASIIETLLKRAFVVREGRRQLQSTPAGRALVDALPEAVKDPATTALWEQGLDEIARGETTLEPFLARQARWIGEVVAMVKAGQMPAGLAALAGQGGTAIPARPAAPSRRPGQGTGGKSGRFGKSETPRPHRARSPQATPPGPVAATPTATPLPVRTKVSPQEEKPFWDNPPPWEDEASWEDGPPPKTPSPKEAVIPTHAPHAAFTAGVSCPRCKQGRLVQRTAQRGPHAGGTFLGCSDFPRCRYTA
ncbi:DNA topoisomerase 3 [Gammaproteobacteria bacterium]